jgi:hypothetical protein
VRVALLALVATGCTLIVGDRETPNGVRGGQLDGGIGGPCKPGNCTTLNADCGKQPDGCGGTLDCGSCGGGLFCGGAGPNHCGSTPCVPVSCSGQCGAISDGCGNVLDCGSCGGGGGDDGGNNDQLLDQDGDGYTPAQGDCNDHDATVGPMAFEVAGNGKDDDCDGQVDETEASCDSAAAGLHDASSLASAVGLCDSRFAVSHTFTGSMSAAVALADFGTSVLSQEGLALAVLSNGIAGRKGDPGWVAVQPGTDFMQTVNAPDPTFPFNAGCMQTAVTTVHDLATLQLTLKVPQNAHSLAFDFDFYSSEFPAYVCTAYNDAFLAMLDGKNIALDAQGQGITINSSLFTVCANSGTQTKCTTSASTLAGSGYGEPDTAVPPVTQGGATGWLTTRAPVTPGSTVTLKLLIYDDGDGVYDSAVVIDALRWSTDALSAPSTTIAGPAN